MAEIVARHLESMTQEIEEMRRTTLFSAEEIRFLIRKRKHFEYKINGVTKNLQDIKDYIQHEKIVLNDIKMRRTKLRIPEKKSSIEFRIMKRVKYLYEMGMQRFSNDFNLCLSYFKFCKESNFHQAASLVIQTMMKNFSHIAKVWEVAAAWYIKRDITQALNAIHKGLTIHKDSQILYCEAIHLELYNIDKDNGPESSQKANELVICKKIETYLQTAYNHIKDYRFPLEVLRILEKYDFTQDVQDSIIKMLMDKYWDEDFVWHALAQRELRGFHHQIPTDLTKKSEKFRVKRCMEKYEEGLSKMSTEKAGLLWAKYLDWLIELPQQTSDLLINNNTLIEKLLKASENTALPEKYFIIWAKLLNDEKEAMQVLDKGLRTIPDSLELWELRLKYSVMKDNVKEFNNNFKTAILELKEKSAPLWIMAIRFHSLASDSRVVEAVYRKGIEQPKEVSDILKPEFIQWVALTKSIKDARKEYKLLANQKPFCKELHICMAKLEKIEVEMDVLELEQIYKLACEQFGHEDTDTWITLLEFYFANYRKLIELTPNFDLNEKVLTIYKEAEFKLSGNNLLLSDFKEKFDRVRHSAEI